MNSTSLNISGSIMVGVRNGLIKIYNYRNDGTFCKSISIYFLPDAILLDVSFHLKRFAATILTGNDS